ncbi:MAG: calcium/sodium antiporter, partial [Ruminococcus sp.]|nr:calcium/sodium antiporter [Ruminococcus sp.]
VLLVKGADFFVEGVSNIASRFGIPQIIIGLTIVAFGTSAPEAAVSITASIDEAGGVAVGNVIGSNIMNIWLILGISAVVSPMVVKKNTVRYEIPFTIGISVVFLILGVAFNSLNRICGVILLLLLASFMVYLFLSAKKEMKQNKLSGEVEEKKKINIPLTLLISVLGGAAVVFGANLSVDAATELAQMCSISEDIIGLTIVAFGTSLPELVTSVIASKKGKNDIAIGNIVGSNIFNLLFVLGAASAIYPLSFGKEFIIDSFVMIGAAITLWLFTVKNKNLSRVGGAVMLAMYAVYFGYLIYEVI